MNLDFLRSSKGDSGETEIEEEFVELDARTDDIEEKEVVIRAETLREFSDVENVQEHLRNNHIVWVNIKQLRNQDMADLKRAVKRLKKTVKSVDGDMAGVDEDWIVVCPSYGRIARSDTSEA